MDGTVSKWLTSGLHPAHLRFTSGITPGTKSNSEIESGYSWWSICVCPTLSRTDCEPIWVKDDS